MAIQSNPHVFLFPQSFMHWQRALSIYWRTIYLDCLLHMVTRTRSSTVSKDSANTTGSNMDQDSLANFDYNCPCQQCRTIIAVLVLLQRQGIAPDVSFGPCETILTFIFDLETDWRELSGSHYLVQSFALSLYLLLPGSQLFLNLWKLPEK